MAGRHIRDMIAAYGDRDDLRFRRAAQAIIQEEEDKRHTTLARELRTALAANTGMSAQDRPLAPEPPLDRESEVPLARVSYPDRQLSDLVLDPQSQGALTQLIREVRNWTSLDAANLPRRNRLLLFGPPGCGKTTAVSALAHDLGRPLVTARVEGLISSYLGETATNLSNLFDFASTGSYVLFLDEFDSLGKMRADASDHGELRRVVNALLQQIDSYHGPSFIVAATNHSQVLDSALWRRFDAIVELGLPSEAELAAVISRLLPAQASLLARSCAARLNGLPHAAAEYFAHSARRHSVLAGRRELNPEDIEQAIEETISRPWL